jgi:transposase-like protein
MHCPAVESRQVKKKTVYVAFPDTTVQICIVHLVRHSLNFCGWKDRKNVVKDLKRVYLATDDVEAEGPG